MIGIYFLCWMQSACDLFSLPLCFVVELEGKGLAVFDWRGKKDRTAAPHEEPILFDATGDGKQNILQ